MPVKVFDPRAEWLIEHQDARPYGDETDKVITGAEPGGEGSSGSAAPAGAGAGARRRPPN